MRIEPVLNQFKTTLRKEIIVASFINGYWQETSSGYKKFKGVLIYKGEERLSQDIPGYTGKGISNLYIDKSLNINISINDTIFDPKNGKWKVVEVVPYSDIVDAEKYILEREEP